MQKAAKFGIHIIEFACNLFEKYKQPLRFAMVGFINTGADFLAFSALHSLAGLDKILSQMAGYCMGTINSFIMNKLWTFEGSKTYISAANQLARFITINLVSLGITLVGLKYLNDILGFNVYASKVLVTLAAQAINYTGYKMLVFAGR